MPNEHDYIILCDSADEERAGFIEDWLDANLKTAHVTPYDSSDHMQFAVQVSQAAKKAQTVILCLSDNFTPLQFPAPQFQVPLQHDPECNKGLVFAVALAPLRETEIKPVISIIDAFSGDERERRRRFIERITATVAPAKKRSPKRPIASAGTTITQNIGKARDVLAAGGNIIQTPKHITRTEFTPDDRHISEATAAKVKIAVEDLANRTLGENGKPNFGMWYNRLNKRFNVGTYRAVLAAETDELLSWISQQKAMSRGKLRRSNPVKYRTDLYSVIWANAKSKNMSKEDVYEFARVKLGLKQPIATLTKLGPNQLKHLSEFIRRA